MDTPKQKFFQNLSLDTVTNGRLRDVISERANGNDPATLEFPRSWRESAVVCHTSRSIVVAANENVFLTMSGNAGLGDVISEGRANDERERDRTFFRLVINRRSRFCISRGIR